MFRLKICKLFLVLVGLLVCTGARADKAQHVILISIDGLAAFHLENPELRLPNIRKLIETGVWPEHLTTVFPSVTHPSHTSLITGVTPRRHGVVGNRVRDRSTGESFHITNKVRSESVNVETLFDWAKKGGLQTASFFWPETRDDPAIDFNIPEVFDGEGNGDINAVPRSAIAELSLAGIPLELYFEWYPYEHLRPAGDILLTRAAAYSIEKHRPAFLAIHLLATDVFQHAYGPEDYMAQNALTVADYCVGVILEALERAGVLKETVLIVTGDHGFVTVDYDLNLWPAFEELDDKLRLSAQGWTLFIEKTGSFSTGDEALLAGALNRVQQVEGVREILTSDRFPELGLPTYDENVLIQGQYLVLGDIDNHLRVEPGLPLGRVRKQRPYHGHGYLPEDPSMHVGVVIAGAGIREGARVGPVKSIDLAPTIGYILGLEVAGVEGRLLAELFESNR